MVGMKIDLEHRCGPWTLRVWGLILNLIGNALALYGAAALVQGKNGFSLLVTGILLTACCIAVLARPSRS